jgi:hypothetical protein
MGENELRLDNERAFWDHHVPELSRCLEEYRQGPDAKRRRCSMPSSR